MFSKSLIFPSKALLNGDYSQRNSFNTTDNYDGYLTVTLSIFIQLLHANEWVIAQMKSEIESRKENDFRKGKCANRILLFEKSNKRRSIFYAWNHERKYIKYNEVANWFSVSRFNSILFYVENSSGFVVFYKLNDRQFNEPDSNYLIAMR